MKPNVLHADQSFEFNGITYPDFGWCVIMCGGPASGQSAAYKRWLRIEGQVYNSDYIKEIKIRRSELDGDELILRDGSRIDLSGIGEPYNMSNSEFAALLHVHTKPLTQKLKNRILHMGTTVDKDRLPTILFDIADPDFEDFMTIIDMVKPLGYKVSIVWIPSGIDDAFANNTERNRQVSDKMVYSKYKNVFRTGIDIFSDKEMVQSINEFWVILIHSLGHGTEKGGDEDINTATAYQLKSKEDMIDLPEKVRTAINSGAKKVDRRKDEPCEKTST